MNNELMTFEEAAALIRSGRPCLVAASEGLLRRLPRGTWVGGTIPYFMDTRGGIVTHEQVFVTALPPQVQEGLVRSYSASELPAVVKDAPDSGCTFVIVPAFSGAHAVFGKDAQSWDGAFGRPLVGWVSGFDLKDLGKASPGVIDGTTGAFFTDRLVALHAKLEQGVHAKLDIVNIFNQGDGDRIRFPRSGFEAGECFVNDEKRNFAEYLTEKQLDTKLPLVADYSGAMVNVSVQAVDAAGGVVKFYAPVFSEMTYRFARPVGDYAASFGQELAQHPVNPSWACNCILNFLYGNLEGKKTGAITGPITFGEIAYMLLNQTLVHVAFERS